MRFMAIEQFKDAERVYRRFRERGRLMPEGLTYVDSWVTADLDRCFVVVECDDERLLKTWADNWDDLVAFEFVSVVSSAAAAAMVLGEVVPGR